MKTTQTQYKFCTQWGCPNQHEAKGLCKTHYLASLKQKKRETGAQCSIENCTRFADSGKLCTSHYRRQRDGNINKPIRPLGLTNCEIENCQERYYARGKCKKHYQEDRPKRPASNAAPMLKIKYGIDGNDRRKLIAAQDGKCAICLAEPESNRPLCVDHDHTHCGGARNGCRECVRGMLCPTCNTRIGKIDGTDWLDRAAAYLANPPARAVLS